MATKQLSNNFMQQIAEEQAWKNLSGDFPWTESLLEKYEDKVDWEEVSENREIQWTIPMVQKFKNRIDWKRFSCNVDEKFLTEDSLEAFKEKWDWKAIIENTHVYLFIRNPIGFYEKYKEHIPASVLQDSGLWEAIISIYKNNLRAKIFV